MGGRGSAFSRSADIAVSVTGSDGKEIDLSEYPLHYDGEDAALTGAVRSAIEAFENKRWKNKIEYSTFVDANGNVIEENRGGKGSVRASLNARMLAEAMSHNHPRSGVDSGTLGGTFSTSDLNNFVRFGQTTYRATAAEGTYGISKGKSFDGKGFSQYYHSESAKNRSAYNSAVSPLNTAVRNGSMKYADYLTEMHKAFNRFLVAEHNSLRAGAKTYGYTYTLERRKSK